MKQNRNLTDLKNIGKKIFDSLTEMGILSEDALRAFGAAEAHRIIKEKYLNETLPVCYYLYSFESAITDKHWDAIGENRKRELKEQIG